VLENTVVIVTSDHGEHFGEHNIIDHMYSLYMPLLHVPLVVVAPHGVSPGARVPEPVSLRDLPATVFALSGVPDRLGFPGTSILSQRTGAGNALVLAEVEHLTEDAVPEWYPAKRGAVKSVISGDWQYIKNFGDGEEELFNLRSDPDTTHNLATTERQRLSEYREALQQLLRSPGSAMTKSATARQR
jgi:arylsulfatase A-like enzyme